MTKVNFFDFKLSFIAQKGLKILGKNTYNIAELHLNLTKFSNFIGMIAP